MREGQDPPLQSRNRCVGIRRGRRPRRPVCTKQSFFGGSKPPPYKYERTSLESVGADCISARAAPSPVSACGFGEYAVSSNTPRHYEECEARRGNPFSLGESFLFCMLLGIRIATPVCALVRNDGVFENNFRFRMRFRRIGRARCAGGSRPSPTITQSVRWNP